VIGLKIGIFLNSSSIPVAGGSFTQREAIVEALTKAKTTHEFFYFFYGNTPTNSVLPNCVPLKGKVLAWVLKNLYYFTGLSFFKKISPLNRALEKNSIDLLYFVEPNPQPVVVPYISTVWDVFHLYAPYFPEILNNEEWEKREKMYQRSLRKSSFVITSTNAGKEEISKFYLVPEEKIRVIKSPVIDALYSQTKSKSDIFKKYSLPKDYFLYPAQFWAHKNHFEIISALKRINEVYQKKVHVAFVGSDKGNKEYIKDLAKKAGVLNQVHFLGFVPTEDLILLYKNAVCTLYLTFLGVEGLPPAEAFVAGCPVIASKTTGLVEQVGSAGLIVDPLNHEELADAMISVQTNKKLRASMIVKGKKLALDLHKEKFAKRLIAVFDEFAELRKRWK